MTPAQLLVVQLLAVFGAALVLSLVVTPLIRVAALRWGLVDKPDGRRKIHAKPVPVAGGVAVFVTSAAVLLGTLACAASWHETLGEKWLRFAGLAVAAGVIAVVGVADDYRGLRGRHKVAGQLLAVVIVIGCGVEVRSLRLFDWTLSLGVLALPFTAFWLLGAINSLNLIDGLDGLLGSIAGIVCASLAVMAALNGQYPGAFIATALAGSLLGFLFYNFPPASIFLGDCGSMLIGLVVGVLAIESSLKGAATVALAAPAALLVIPILDTAAAIVRRKLTGRSIYATDRGHLHHVLLRHGLSNAGILLLVGGLCLVASVGALLSMVTNNELLALLSVLVIVAFLLISKLFGRAEFLLIKERLSAALFAVRHGHEDGRVHQLEVRLQGSADWNELWRNVTLAAAQYQLAAVCLDVNAPALHEAYHARWGRVQGESENPGLWRTQLPLAFRGQIVGRLEVAGARSAEPIWDHLALVAKMADDVEALLDNLTGPPAPPTLEARPVPAAGDRARVPAG